MLRAQVAGSAILAAHVGQPPTSIALSTAEAKSLALAYRLDAKDAIYSGAFSICEAIQALDRGLFTWSTVKLYYSVFYLARAELGLTGVGLVYSGKTPLAWPATPGSVPKKQAGPTHKATLDAFADFRSGSPLLSQPVGAAPAFEWLVSRREQANYTEPKFLEPSVPRHFEFVARYGVRRLLVDYCRDHTYLFTFDPDHAMLAFPVAALREAMTLLRSATGAGLAEVDVSAALTHCRDSNGPIAEMWAMMNAK